MLLKTRFKNPYFLFKIVYFYSYRNPNPEIASRFIFVDF